MKRGKLIVIDGTDGSGKATQAKILIERLRKEGKKAVSIDFPRYEDNFFGKFIGHCLTERYYDFMNIHPKIASVIYAADRFESKKVLEDWLKKEYTVVCDRYASSSKIHQGSKIKSHAKRQALLSWLDTMEHQVFGIPRPDIIVFLDVPVPVSQKLLADKWAKAKKKYAKGKQDVAEADTAHLTRTRATALWLSKIDKTFHRIGCTDGRRMRSIESIHEDVFEYVMKKLKTK